MLISLLLQNPLIFVVIAISLIFSLSFHEFAHAFAANKLGDSTAKSLGRLTINPLAHLDLVGTLMLLFAGIGWGKPVPFNPMYLKHPKRDGALIAVAGPSANFILATVAALLIHALGSSPIITSVLLIFITLNLSLGFFNLLPFNPLDGFKVVLGLLPNNLAIQWIQTQGWGIYILLLLILTRQTGAILEPLLNLSLRILGLGAAF